MIFKDLSPKTIEQLKKFSGLFFEKNQQLNLSGIRDKEGIWLRHIHDSLVLLETAFDLKPVRSVLDLGTGGGLPGIPLAIVFPDKQFTLVDATGKKIAAVSEFIKQLGLKNAVAIQGRAEVIAHSQKFREKFDLVVARAVAEFNILSEYALPLVKPGGYFIAYKARKAERELAQAKKAIQLLGGIAEDVIALNVPELGHRSFVVIQKKKTTPAFYPRHDGKIRKNPL
ncbi:16S rRNA (guanine(527)-N(7))-methyltransferase RsmG [Candidatus Peregrinibacteria bacterium]|nr:16S rRNA (guanine(527)-N(7))-methyltransferase RsmG [Candidatus Peregrinibacteria bacterium]